MGMEPGDRRLARLRWACRRGMLELDVLLERFVSMHLESLRPSEIDAFGKLLQQSDQDLHDWLLKGSAVADPDLRGIVGLIRESVHG